MVCFELKLDWALGCLGAIGDGYKALKLLSIIYVIRHNVKCCEYDHVYKGGLCIVYNVVQKVRGNIRVTNTCKILTTSACIHAFDLS